MSFKCSLPLSKCLFEMILLFQINGKNFLPHVSSSILFTSSTLVLQSSSRVTVSEIRMFKLVFFHRFCKIYDLFRLSLRIESRNVGFGWSYISVVFAVVKGLTLTKDLRLMDLVSRYPSIFFIILSPTINTVFFDFFAL